MIWIEPSLLESLYTCAILLARLSTPLLYGLLWLFRLFLELHFLLGSKTQPKLLKDLKELGGWLKICAFILADFNFVLKKVVYVRGKYLGWGFRILFMIFWWFLKRIWRNFRINNLWGLMLSFSLRLFWFFLKVLFRIYHSSKWPALFRFSYQIINDILIILGFKFWEKLFLNIFRILVMWNLICLSQRINILWNFWRIFWLRISLDLWTLRLNIIW
jgi:hypothetical protein